VTNNVKPETQNWRLEPTGLAKPGETCGLTEKGLRLARQDSVGRVFARAWNRTDLFLRSKPGPLVGYPDPLLTLPSPHLTIFSLSILPSCLLLIFYSLLLYSTSTILISLLSSLTTMKYHWSPSLVLGLPCPLSRTKLISLYAHIY